MFSSQPVSHEEQTVLEIITNHRGLISIVFDIDWQNPDPQVDYQSIDKEYLDQISNPTKNRPSRTATLFAENNQTRPNIISKMDMRTGEIYEYEPGRCRETKHKGVEFQHTAKTPTSLIPPDPRYMELFESDYGIGFLWDIDDCNIKEEKYVFPRDAGTNNCFWLNLDTDEKITELRERLKNGGLTTVKGLRQQNMNAITQDKPITWNEILAGLPKNNLQAVFATQDVRSVRLRALQAMLHAKEKLNYQHNLPVLVLQPYYEEDETYPQPRRQAVFRFYSQQEQEADLKADLEDKLAAESALEIIKQHRALALPLPDNKDLPDYLNQLSDPVTHRPSLSEFFFKQQGKERPAVLKKVNLQTFEREDYQPGQCRYTKHKDVEFTHTAKIPTILLPPEPQWMDLGGNDGSMDYGQVGLLFDVDTCDLKNEKYVFPHQENISDCFWLDIDSDEKLLALKQRFKNETIGSIEALRKRNDDAVRSEKIIGANTVFAGLPKGQVAGVYCLVNRIDLSNCYKHCVRAKQTAERLKEKLQLEHVPVFIIQPGNPKYNIKPVFRIYSDTEYYYHSLNVNEEMNNPNQLNAALAQKKVKNASERTALFQRLFSQNTGTTLQNQRDEDLEMSFVMVERNENQPDDKTEKSRYCIIS